MLNTTAAYDVPPLPAYTEAPLPDLLPPIPDKLLVLILPIVAYWGVSMIFHYIDVYDLFSQYRLHTPAEVLKRNHVTRYEVVRDVILQQIIQTIFGLAIGYADPVEMTGKDEYNVAVWASRLRLAQKALPGSLAIVGFDALSLASKIVIEHPTIAGILSGGHYPQLVQNLITPAGQEVVAPAFARWEMVLAYAIYWYIIPAIQFFVAISFVDTWQYFLHRTMHMNKFLYTWLHSRHHRLYVPYAFGALYNHPLEGFLLDTFGTGLAFILTGMSTRQAMWFFTCSTIKTVDDHCGYSFPWDPLQWVTENNAAYHDIHHQSWGIKTNFSQPFFVYWDRVLGTMWTGGDVSARYERSRIAAQRALDEDAAAAPITHSPATDLKNAEAQAKASQEQVVYQSAGEGAKVLQEEAAEEQEAKNMVTRSMRKKAGSIDPKGDSLKGLRERVIGNLHGWSTAIVGTDASQ